MRGQALIVAAAAFVALAQPAAAQNRDYHDQHVADQVQCERTRNGNTAAGAVFGGILGAILGSQVSGSGRRGDGSVVGGVVGAATGAAIANSNSRCLEPQGDSDPYAERYPGAKDGELEGGPYAEDSAYERDYGRDDGRREECRMGQIITRDPTGREHNERVMMCRGRDGAWRPQG
jgi:Glycine zipper 2TM domain